MKMVKNTQKSQRNTYFKRRSPILLTFLILTITLISLGSVGAVEWNDRLTYSKNDLKVSLDNWWGLGKTIGTAELKSHKSVDEIRSVSIGESVVMWYDFNFEDIYLNGIGNVEIININTEEIIQRNYDFVYWGNETYQVPNYVCNDFLTKNGTEKRCSQSGTRDKTTEAWLPYATRNIPKGNIRIGLKIDIFMDETLDLVWKIGGKKIEKHAVVSSGAIETIDGDFTVLTFLNNGTFNVTDDSITAEVLVVGGGGGASADHAGGGGAGGYLFNSSFVIAVGDYNVSVGIGGDGRYPSAADNGQNSSFSTMIAWGGGSGSQWNTVGIDGGSGGGGGGHSVNFRAGGSSLDSQGNAGGSGHGDTGATQAAGGGGGGKGSAGGDGAANVGGNGGTGTSNNITNGTELFYASGGGGGVDAGDTAGTASNGGGSAGSTGLNTAANATANTGGGGGGGGGEDGVGVGAGGWGGSGIVIIRFLTPTIFPTINLDSPEDNANFTLTNNVTHNATIFDDFNITNVTLYLDNVINETNLTSGLNNTVWTFNVVGLSEGDHPWNIEACNFNDTCANGTARTYNVNTTPNIQYGDGVPENEANITDDFFDVNVTITENLFENITFDLYNRLGSVNETVTFTNSSRNVNWTNLPDGNYSYNVTVATNTLQFNSTATRNISIDSNFPSIILTSPTGDQGTFTSGLNLSLNWTASDVNIDVCQYDYEGSNTTVNCSSISIGFIVTDSLATNLTFYVNDTFGQMSSNFTSWSYSFIENNVTFTSDVFETDSQFFEINLSTSLTVSAISAQLNYNGTNFISSAACGDFCLVNNTIDIPLVNEGEFENKSFFWEISIFNGTDSINVNTSSTEQNVTRIHLEECGGSFTVEALNFTAYDEQNLSRIDPYLFDGDFEQWLGGGDVKRQSNFSESSISEQTLCISPEDETFFIDSTIEYDEAGNESLYILRNYYFQNDTISNTTQEIFMYLLQSSSSTTFILKVQDDALLPVPNVLIETNRFYPGLNEFRIVQIAKTDDLGKSVGFFETEIVDYKFIITFNNDTLLETGIQKVIPEVSPFTLTFNLGDPLGEPWSSQIDIENLISTLVWDNTLGVITYTYSDNSTNLTLARLFVIQQSLINSSADSTLCDVNSSLDAAVLTCDVGNTSGFYTASSFITRDSVETLDLQISFQIETLSAIVGLLGLFYGWFLILIASFMFKFNEIAGIWAITITLLLVNIMGLINFGGVFVTAVIGVAILLTWLMSN